MICYSLYAEAEHIAKKYDTRSPMDLIRSVPNMKLWLTDAYDSDGLKGYATIQNRIKYVVVNSLLSIEEQKVVAAHELGHIFLHENYLKSQPLKDFNIYSATGKLEREANIFAADFLISDEIALELIQSLEGDFFASASVLKIPPQFFAFKLYSLAQRGNDIKIPVDINSSFLKSKS